MINELVKQGYDSDPVKAWKKSHSDEDEDENTPESGPDYNYLLSMQLWSLTKEKKDELLKNRDKKVSLYLHVSVPIY